MPQALSEQTRQKIKELYDQGVTSKSIAEEIGCSTFTVTRILKSFGAQFSTGRKPAMSLRLLNMAEEVKNLYDSGLGLETIARSKSINVASVKKILKEAGVTLRTGAEQRSLWTEDKRRCVAAQISATKLSEDYRAAHPDLGSNKRLHLPEETWDILSSAEKLQSYILYSGEDSVVAIQQDLGCSYSTLERALKEFGLWGMLNHFTSLGESQLRDFISSFGINFTTNVRSLIHPYEIDIYIPESNVGIEFNGSYWHSDIHKNRSYHFQKSIIADSKGIFIYHVFEYEWNDPETQKKIKNQIQNLLGFNQRKVFARNCEVKVVDSVSDFLKENHVQGNRGASVKLGLFIQDEMVAVMTFGQAHFSRGYDWELQRFCAKAGVSVVGGASKLFKYFVRNFPGSIVSYADIAKTRGKIYETLGFTLDHISDPNYVWVKNQEVLKRYATQMKDEDLIMRGRGFFKVYDCGNKVFSYS